MTKLRKPLGAIFLVFVMIFATVITACAAEYENKFTDVSENAWYAEAVKYCDENGLMSGISEDSFLPNGTMTRAMLATALYRQAGSPDVSGNDDFPDTADGAWYSNAVRWASQQEIITGYSNGNFGTNDSVTREQIVTMLWRMAGRPETGDNVQARDFADEEGISPYAADAVDWASANGVINGKPDNRFDPKGAATRAEVAAILMNNAELEDGVQSDIDNPMPKHQDGSDSPSGSKVLIAYFSATNNTENIANYINTVLENDNIDADLYEIVPQDPYTSEDLDYSNDSCRANIEQHDDSARPEISGSVSNIEDYDTVFLGYPIWWSQAPKIMYTFVESYDFTGKTIVPFCTSGGSGIGSSAENLKNSASGASWLAGQRFSGSASQADVEHWVKSLDIYESIKSMADEDNMADGKLYIKVEGAQNAEWTATLAENSSVEALKKLLAEGEITIDMHDYSNFEKVGPLGATLPTNDEQITTQAGDLILYQGSSFVIYYDTNSFSLTRLGKIDNVSQEEMKHILGTGNVTITLSINQR